MNSDIKRGDSVGLSALGRRDFWNLGINPITGLPPVTECGFSPKQRKYHVSEPLQANYGPTANYI